MYIPQNIIDTPDATDTATPASFSHGVVGDALLSRAHLSLPLDAFTKRAIQTMTLYPVTVNLPGTMPATAANYATFFVADRSYSIESISEVHGTAGTDAGAVTLQIERLQGTEALDAGDAILASTFNLKGTANTVQNGTLLATDVKNIYAGNRLALKDAGTLTAVANLTVTVILSPI